MVRLAPLALVFALACDHAASARGVGCFDVTSTRNSASTRSVFAARHCQGGGVTWAPILGALVARRGVVVPIREPVSGMTGDVAILDAKTRFAIDEEGDAARFCSDDRGLLNAINADYLRLNRDATELRRAMSEASPLAMECLDENGKLPPLPALNPMPSLPAKEATAVSVRVARLKALIAREPVWCFAASDPQRRAGLLRFVSGDRVIQTQRSGERIAEGIVNWPREGSGDDRVELVFQPTRAQGGAALLHLDIGPSGQLGESYADKHNTRLDLIPGSICLGAR